jgi:macrolide-specific efflux system membrane fusion protein
VTSAQAALQLASHPYTAQDIAIAQASVTQAQQTLSSDQSLFAGELEIRAPSAGVVQAVNIVPGMLTSNIATGTAAIQTEASEGLEVIANIPEAQFGTVQVGDPVAMVFNAFPGKTFVGLVTKLPLQAVTTSNVTTYPIHISIKGSTQGLTAGMTASLTIVTGEVQNAVEVPNQAITTTGRGSFVQTLDAHNNVTLAAVQVGASDSTNTQIVSGLNVGDRIVVPTASSTTGATGGGAGRLGGGGFAGGGFGGGGFGGRGGGG